MNGEWTKSLEWLQSTYFSQILQIARPDPGYYALVAITSRNLWQISFPYYLKGTLPGDGIAFEHIDLSVKRLQEYGILPHSRTYYCLLFSLYHMFIIFVISY